MLRNISRYGSILIILAAAIAAIVFLVQNSENWKTLLVGTLLGSSVVFLLSGSLPEWKTK